MSVLAKLIGAIIISLSCYSIQAKNLKVSIPIMPVHAEASGKGILISFAHAIGEEIEQDIEVELTSFARAMGYVSDGLVDFHLPLIKYETLGKEQNYIYSDETIFHVNFVLYSNKNHPLNINEIATYKIETESAHQSFFPFSTSSSSCLLCSLKRVQHRAIDGFVFADSSTDPLLKEHQDSLKDVNRQLYRRFEVKVVFPKNEQGKRLNEKISAAIRSMRASGKLKTLLNAVDFPYDNWQLTDGK